MMDIKEHNEQAKAWLRRYRILKQDYNAALSRMNELISIQESTGAIKYSDMPKVCGGCNSDLSDFMVIREREQQKCKQLEKRMLLAFEDISEAINNLPTEDERMLMTLRYINGLKWVVIADRMNRSEKSVKSDLHSKALTDIIIPTKK